MVIAKIIPRKRGKGSFRDSINYNLGLSRNDTDKVEYVNTFNIFAPEVAIAEMESLASENVRSANPVFNCILSWRENEIPTKQQTDEAVEIALKELGLEGCLTHFALHKNTENLHLHICVNRIDPETYRARDPAHGWTKKALEKAARKIELAQGWQIERTGRYVVTPDGEILEKSNDNGKQKLSQTARDIEAHTGEKSAERVGQETAAPIIRDAKTWVELHQKLAQHGIAFERKGSGAVLHIGETVIKASQAGRDISLSKLEKRLGKYRERQELGDVELLNAPKPEAIERVNMVPKVKKSWEEYQEAKATYLSAKKETFAELKKRQGDERKSQTESQREERSKLFSTSWKGKGAELNQHRSVMAAQQQGKKLDLRDRQREEREKTKKCFSRQFPSFKKWLSLDSDKEILSLFRYPEQMILSPAENSKNSPLAKTFDLRNYSPKLGNTPGRVMYCREGTNVADFIDYGKRIVLAKKFDEASVLAALQLASQKWGAIQITGSQEYKDICVSLAVKHGFKIANPELKAEIEAVHEQREKREREQREQREKIFGFDKSRSKDTGMGR